MPAFRYEAVDATGRPRRGLLDAASARAVRDVLRGDGLFPTALEPAAGAFAAVNWSGATPRSRQYSIVPIVSNVFGPGPPLQCAIPGTMKRRIQASWLLPIFSRTLS